MPDASTQTDLSLLNVLEFRHKPVEAPPTGEKTLEYKREAIVHAQGTATAPPSAGMVQWLGTTITRPHIASEFNNLSEAELRAHEERRKATVAELLRLRKGYKEHLRKEPYLHWHPSKTSTNN
ncbi:hypothetical protein C8F04DRAFT_1272799 [Mycena alexandri]|uniref:Uncharacterized protein n=1 Tax=Mycena alexandri TaxID=1745969 RepID=A0AAD6WPJ1_9AGAR|nr:hypothetical protein C8F04DRAFT_1272799 [Mycena alexandri]